MGASGSSKNHGGTIVPMVTPLTSQAELDEAAVERLIEFFWQGGVHGVFVLGTTGEGPAVPRAMRDRLVRLVKACAGGRLLVYANVSENLVEESAAAGNRYFDMGVDAVVAHAPACYEPQPELSVRYFTDLAQQLNGELIIYNMPLTTSVSVPLDVCHEVARKPRVVGIKDSENNAERHQALLQRVGGLNSFSVFVGTGPLMASGLLGGARGIVPSVGNLAPGLCRALYDCASRGDKEGTEVLNHKFLELAQVYQKGRTLGESLAALKGAMACLGLCGPQVFAPLKPVSPAERRELGAALSRLGLIGPKGGVSGFADASEYRPTPASGC